MKLVLRHFLAGVLLALLPSIAPIASETAVAAEVRLVGVPRDARQKFDREDLAAPIRENGEVRVIVGLQTPEEIAQVVEQISDEVKEQRVATRQSRLLQRLSRHNARNVNRLRYHHFLALTVDAAALDALLADPEVTSIEEDRPVYPVLFDTPGITRADRAWAEGYRGAGQTVAIIDTGVDKTHPFFSGKVVAEACFSRRSGNNVSFCPGGVSSSIGSGAGVPCPDSGCWHGTHVAGIAAGRFGILTSTTGGIAPDANVIAIQVFQRECSGTSCGGIVASFSDLVRSLDHVYSLRQTYNIASVNLSLGGDVFSAPCDASFPSFKTVVDSLRSANIATVIAAGNSGNTGGLSVPGCISSAISVGSTDKQNAISGFSNSASFLSLLAPGSSVTSSVPGGYGGASGTSMATPHVAGAWAVLKSAKPSATVNELLTALQNTGVPITDPRNGIVKSLIQIGNTETQFGGVNNAQFVSQSVPATMTAGQSYAVSITFQNTGTTTWSAANAYNLGAHNPQDNTTWGMHRVALPSTVAPGANVTFSFNVSAPSTPGTYNFQWAMVQDGVEWFGALTPNVTVNVQAGQGVNNAQFVSQSVPATMTAGQSYAVSITFQNTGTTAWSAANAYNLGARNPQDNTTWGMNRVALPATVAPGANVTFSFNVSAPSTPGIYNFQWAMVQDGVEWFGALTPNVTVNVQAGQGVNNAQFVSQSVPATMTAGQSYAVSITFQNTGTTTWSAANAYNLGARNPQDNTTWGMNRVALPATVAPGANVTFSFNVSAPSTPGIYNFQWAMVQDGVEWFGALTPNVTVNVQAGQGVNNAQFVSQSVPATMTAGQSYAVSITFQNTGTTTWSAANAYNLGAHNPQDNTTWGMHRVALPSTVAPGANVTFSFNVSAPSTPGTYNFQWAMVQDGVEWFGALTPNVTVDVQAGQVPSIALQSVASGFSSPLGIEHAGDSRIFVVQQGGQINIISGGGQVLPTPFLNVESLIVSGGEQGLLGFAFHPNYATNGFFYLNYTRQGDGATVIARYQRSASDPNVADPNSAQILLTVAQPFANHNGGQLRFGPDGYLYIALGDGGSGNDPGNRAQNLATPLGKMLRIDVDNGSPYAIPPSNPFLNDGNPDTLPEIWAYGLRNPWRFSFDRLTGDLFIADVGQSAREEINFQAGRNWRGRQLRLACHGRDVVHRPWRRSRLLRREPHGSSPGIRPQPGLFGDRRLSLSRRCFSLPHWAFSLWGLLQRADLGGDEKRERRLDHDSDAFVRLQHQHLWRGQAGEIYVAAYNTGVIYRISMQ